jgi:hypothetical protein
MQDAATCPAADMMRAFPQQVERGPFVVRKNVPQLHAICSLIVSGVLSNEEYSTVHRHTAV